MDDGSYWERVFMVSMNKGILGLMEGGGKCLTLNDDDDSDDTEEALEIEKTYYDIPEISNIPKVQADGSLLSRIFGFLGF